MSDELSNTMLPPTRRMTDTVTIPKNSLTGLDNSNRLYME